MDLSFFYSSDAPMVGILSIEHLVYLGVCLFVLCLMIKHYRYVKQEKGKIAKILFYVLMFQQIFLLYGWYAIFD